MFNIKLVYDNSLLIFVVLNIFILLILIRFIKFMKFLNNYLMVYIIKYV